MDTTEDELTLNLRSRVVRSIREHTEQYERHRHDKKTESIELNEAHDARREKEACMRQIRQKEALPYQTYELLR